MHIIENKNIPWAGGWYMDIHTIKSIRTPEGGFQNTRSEIGEMLYRYKYEGIRSIGASLADLIFNSIKTEEKLSYLSCITWIPSSKPRINPVLEPIAIRLSKKIGCDFNELVLKKRDRPSVKHKDRDEVEEALEDAFKIDEKLCKSYNGKKVLIIDDLYRTGTSMRKAAELIRQNSSICLYGIAITKTRTHPNDR